MSHRFPKQTSHRTQAVSTKENSHGALWQQMWILALLVGLMVVMNVYYDDHALDTSFLPRLRGLYATLLAAVLLVLLPGCARRLDLSVLRDPLLISFGCFAAVNFLTLGLAINATAGLTDAFRNFGTWVWLCLLYLLLPTLPHWKERLLQILVCGIGLSAAWGYYEIVTTLGWGFHSRASMSSIAATMANVNLYAGFLAMALPFALCGAVLLSGWWKVAAVVTALGAAVMVVLLQTRAAYLGVAVSLALALLLAVLFGPALGVGRRARAGLGVTGLAVVGIVAALYLFGPESNPVVSRLRSIGAGVEDSSAGARIMAWRITLQMVADHFPWGVGTGNFTMRLDEYFNDQTDFRGEGTNWIYPHNDFLWVLVEQGVVGALFFAGIFCLAFFHCFTALRRSKSLQDAWLAVAVIMVLVAYLIDSLFGFPLARVSHQIYLAVALALAVLLAREASDEVAVAPPSTICASYPRKLLLGAVPVLVVLAVGFTYARAAMKQEFYLAMTFALEAEGMLPAALRVVRAAQTPWKTTDFAATPIAYHEARILKEIGTPYQTLEALERAYRQNPNRIFVINDLGSYYAKAGRFDEAIELLTRTVERYPHQIICVENLALCHMDNNNYAKALEILEGIPEDKRTDSIREKIARCHQELNLSPQP